MRKTLVLLGLLLPNICFPDESVDRVVTYSFPMTLIDKVPKNGPHSVNNEFREKVGPWLELKKKKDEIKFDLIAEHRTPKTVYQYYFFGKKYHIIDIASLNDDETTSSQKQYIDNGKIFLTYTDFNGDGKYDLVQYFKNNKSLYHEILGGHVYKDNMWY